MKKQEMLDTLKKQGETLLKEFSELQNQVTAKREQILRIEGALEALALLEDETPVTSSKEEVPDHTAAAKALGI